jgi:hypothetical protein
MAGRADPSGQRWSTFLRNHSPHIAAMDLFVVPTIGFNLLYVLVIVRLARREVVWLNVTAHPTAEWIAQQITEAFPWTQTPRYLIRDRDAIYGAAVTRPLRWSNRRASFAKRTERLSGLQRTAPTITLRAMASPPSTGSIWRIMRTKLVGKRSLGALYSKARPFTLQTLRPIRKPRWQIK